MPDPSSIVEAFRTSGLPPDATIALVLGNPEHTVLVAHEIQRIQRGEIAPLQVDIDQVSAFVLLGYLTLAVESTVPNPATPVVEKFIAGLQASIARNCPELAATWETIKQQRGGQS